VSEHETIILDRSKTPKEVISKYLWWQKKGLMYTSTGYGSKIPTEYMIRYKDRWRRVYCCIWSNCGTNYIISKKQKIIVDIR